MALRNEEIIRLKYELGYNVTGVGADVYIQYSAVFDRAVQPYLIDASTTSATTIPAGAGVANITLASNPASITSTQSLQFVVGSNVVIDVGVAKETSVIQSVSGLTITLNLVNAHSGTYPVVLQGAEQVIRDCFDRLDQIKGEMLNVAPKTAGIAAITGEIEFFSSGHQNRKGGRTKFEDLMFQRTIARRDLAGALGIPYLLDLRSAGGANFEVY